MHVNFENPKTRQKKSIKVGWSWTCFLFATFFGLPLFLRKLNGWGLIMCVLGLVGIVLMPFRIDPNFSLVLSYLLGFAQLGLSIYLGLKANQMGAKRLLELGWQPMEPEGQDYRWAKEKWAIA